MNEGVKVRAAPAHRPRCIVLDGAAGVSRRVYDPDTFGVQPLEFTNTLKILQDIDKSAGRLYRIGTGWETGKLAAMPDLQLMPPKCDRHLHGFDGFEELDCFAEWLPSNR